MFTAKKPQLWSLQTGNDKEQPLFVQTLIANSVVCDTPPFSLHVSFKVVTILYQPCPLRICQSTGHSENRVGIKCYLNVSWAGARRM